MFGLKELQFLGHVVSADGIRMDPSTLTAMAGWPGPKTIKVVSGFLGWLVDHYRQFKNNFSRLVLPLTDLDIWNQPFAWSPEAQLTFEGLKNAMGTGPVMQTPDFRRSFKVFTAACRFASGATLAVTPGLLEASSILLQAIHSSSEV